MEIIYILTCSIIIICAAQLICKKMAKNSSNIFLSHVAHAIRYPIIVVISMQTFSSAGIIISHKFFLSDTAQNIDYYISQANTSSIVINVVWFILIIINKIEEDYIKNKSHKFLKPIVSGGRIIFIIMGLMELLYIFGFNAKNILAFGGLGSLVVGLAARDILSNIIGSITVNMEESFSVGEVIKILDNNIEGRVEEISWRLTSIRQHNQTIVHITNSLLSKATIENKSRINYRMIEEILYIEHKKPEDLQNIIITIQNIIKNKAAKDKNIINFARLDSIYGTIAIITIRFFIASKKLQDYNEQKTEIILQINAAITHKYNAYLSAPPQNNEKEIFEALHN